MNVSASFAQEERLWAAGFRLVAGVDEAGRGALAGPVVAAAVIVAPATAGRPEWKEMRDSKRLSPSRRVKLETVIKQLALAWGVGSVPAAVIDARGIAAATRQAMATAIENLTPAPDYLLIDWVRLPAFKLPQFCVPKADATMISVAAASILAKVHRDRQMIALDEVHPAYGFAAHKGYGAAAHLATLSHFGPCAEHRRSFAPLAQATGLFVEEGPDGQA